VQFKTVGDGLQSAFANTGIIKDGINIAVLFTSNCELHPESLRLKNGFAGQYSTEAL
jgi:hypothetical protein